LLAPAKTGNVAPYKRCKTGTMPPEVFHTPCPSVIAGNTAERSLAAIAYSFAADLDFACVAAVFVEQVQGEGGCHVAPTEFLAALCMLVPLAASDAIIDEGLVIAESAWALVAGKVDA
jgi:4-aminobutyrate aminotransferase/(S)-3-amino-2-methylpropionate transaminase